MVVQDDPSTSIPEAWVRAAILVRANTLARGHSGVRLTVIKSLEGLLNQNIIPLIPLRGSISASGDLCPLSYIAGALQGRPGIKVWVDGPRDRFGRKAQLANGLGLPDSPPPSSHASEPASEGDESDGPDLVKFHRPKFPAESSHAHDRLPTRQCMPALKALSESQLEPLKIGPKEGLALVNGTAVSAAAGALAMHQAQIVAVFAQILTAMSVEALRGTADSFDEFLNNTRPHPGQVEAARNIRGLLSGSKLVRTEADETDDPGVLRQDRYSLRTTPQWVGPQLENLMLAQQQIETECNSTTDNPIIDYKRERVLHGGNFQALHVTSAMEKVRQSIQNLGRMIFVQCAELLDPTKNNGLPPNLEAGEPSQGYFLKGIDVNVAALLSELGFLANPVSSHVQTAEMGNQALNSMAFVSARYTHTALGVITHMIAAHVLALCHGLDLRCLQREYFQSLRPRLATITAEKFGAHLDEPSLSELSVRLWDRFQLEFHQSTCSDSDLRFPAIVKKMQGEILACSELNNTETLFSSLTSWRDECTQLALHEFRTLVATYDSSAHTAPYLSAASRKIWKFVRTELDIPFHDGQATLNGFEGVYKGETIGGMVTRIYSAMQDGSLVTVAMDAFADAIST